MVLGFYLWCCREVFGRHAGTSGGVCSLSRFQGVADGGIVAFWYNRIDTAVLVVGDASIDLLRKYSTGDVPLAYLAALPCAAMRATSQHPHT